MSKTKKIILAVSMLLVLAVAAYLNFSLLNQNLDDDDDVPTGNFFATYRQNWENMRSVEIAELNEIIGVEGDEYAEARASALAQKQKIINLMETERLLESLLSAKGYAELVITMGVDSNNINVIVSAEDFTLQDSAVIYNTIISEMNVSPDYVKILPIK